MQTIAGYTAFQRQIAREGLTEHDGCCTPGARCWMADKLEKIAASTTLAQDVHPDADRRMPRGNGTVTTGRGSAKRLATDAQMKFVNSLLSQIANGANERIRAAHEIVTAGITTDTVTHGGLLMSRVDAILRMLKEAVAEQRAATPAPVRTQSAPTAPRAVMTEGMYELDSTVYRVKLSGAGRLYAMRLVITDGIGEFVYAEGMMRTLRPEHRMSLERASELSVRYHFCIRCAKELTKKSSIAQGMGDICASKM